MRATTCTRRLIRLMSLPAISLGLALSAHAQQQAAQPMGRGEPAASSPAQAAQNYRAVLASRLIGMEVNNPQGNNIGQINDVIVDMTSGQVHYAMLEFDPGILQGERLFAVPTRELRLSGDRDRLAYSITRDRLERAAVDRAAWDRDTGVSQDNLRRFDSTWGIVTPSGAAHAHRLSDLIGKDVKSRGGEDIGDVDDVVIDMGRQRVHYAVLAFDTGWASPERRFAFPLQSFELTDDRDELTLDVDREKVNSMESFTEDRYGMLNDRAWVMGIDRDIHRYLGSVTPSADLGADTNRR
jgi:sporulation protein YlmC with PRC-barrel domain